MTKLYQMLLAMSGIALLEMKRDGNPQGWTSGTVLCKTCKGSGRCPCRFNHATVGGGCPHCEGNGTVSL